ncbi:hypothetical protein FPSE_08921 [Fusarium pseudograminearum CS3096]|uniref:Uncharacterized protein n=1 Tax=Fusarium pseudograminearum (strain CS3096) TaxID=1028729 RepID=K3VYL7_FUSPC|nr:hypothetical protein FPSE_08921 [Fusarium pseudograminearum CS3096]EKJ70870.1 hypothetical protein FPSE_08921 [Fusarium pseudograminearum CS3096]
MYKPMSVRPFCTLCEAAFQEGEHVVIIKEDAEQPLQSVEFNMSQLEFIKSGATESTEASETTNSDPESDPDLHLDSDSTLNSEGLSWSDYLRYTLTWENDGKWSLASHLTCAEYLISHGLTPWKIAKVLAGDFALSPSAAAQRRYHVQTLARVEPAQPSDEDILSEISKLPPEITQQVVRWCLPHIMMCHGTSLPGLREPEPDGYWLNHQGPIWATFISLQGNHYISRLSNKPNDGSFSVFIRPPSDGNNTFYVAHDHLGVRKVIFAIPDNKTVPDTTEDTVLWWETITFTAMNTQVKVISDGVKVRSLYRTPGLKRPAKTYWPSPMKPQDHPRVARLNRGAKGLPMVKRMRPLVLNDVGMNALSACCYSHNGMRYCLALVAHYPNTPAIRYQDYSRHLPSRTKPMWLHFVLDEGEQITEIWGWQTHSRSSDLVMRTSKGRIWNIGPMVSEREPFNWNHLVDLPTGEPSTIYFDESLRGINQLAFQEKNKPLVGAKAAPEVTTTPVTGSWRRNYFYFSERLKGLLTITPCWIKNRNGLTEITGLVLRYGDGRVRTLGVVRLDCLAEPIDVTASAGMSLSRKDITHIVDIQTHPHKVETSESKWFPWRGRLTWWGRYWGGISLFHEVPEDTFKPV